MDLSGLLWCFYLMFRFSISDGAHSLQRIHWWASTVMLNVSKSIRMKKQTHLLLGWPEYRKGLHDWISLWFSINMNVWIQSCLESTVRAGNVIVWGIFSWHTLVTLVPTKHRLNTTARVLLLTMSIPFWPQCTHLVMATSSRITHRLTKLKLSQTGLFYMTMS